MRKPSDKTLRVPLRKRDAKSPLRPEEPPVLVLAFQVKPMTYNSIESVSSSESFRWIQLPAKHQPTRFEPSLESRVNLVDSDPGGVTLTMIPSIRTRHPTDTEEIGQHHRSPLQFVFHGVVQDG